jgi:hypothetical protein
MELNLKLSNLTQMFCLVLPYLCFLSKLSSSLSMALDKFVYVYKSCNQHWSYLCAYPMVFRQNIKSIVAMQVAADQLITKTCSMEVG